MILMKNFSNNLILLLTISIIGPSHAGIYDDWPDESICTWLELKPKHEGYLKKKKKRDLNCFERDDFNARIEPDEVEYSASESNGY